MMSESFRQIGVHYIRSPTYTKAKKRKGLVSGYMYHTDHYIFGPTLTLLSLLGVVFICDFLKWFLFFFHTKKFKKVCPLPT